MSLGNTLNQLNQILPQILMVVVIYKLVFNEILHLASLEIAKDGKVVYEIRLKAEEGILKKLSDELSNLLKGVFEGGEST
ncbi:MAG: hypothetical protein QXI58_04410 [Candidatus Micrarchaeia archaeon]